MLIKLIKMRIFYLFASFFNFIIRYRILLFLFLIIKFKIVTDNSKINKRTRKNSIKETKKKLENGNKKL